MSRSYEVSIEKPGQLTYREGNYEYRFPFYEQDGETIVVDFSTRRRVYLLFGWFTVPNKYPSSGREEVHSRLIAYFHQMGKHASLFKRDGEDEQSFAFHPELLEQKGIATTLLENAGFTWLSDYSSVDVLHSEYGLEVCGIREETNVSPIAEAMQNGFPQWHYHGISRKDYGAEAGWKFSIHMFPRCCGGDQCVDK